MLMHINYAGENYVADFHQMGEKNVFLCRKKMFLFLLISALQLLRLLYPARVGHKSWMCNSSQTIRLWVVH